MVLKKMILSAVFLVSLSFLNGCLEDGNPVNGNQTDNPADSQNTEETKLFVVQSDLIESGLLEFVDTEKDAAAEGSMSIYNDAVVRAHQGYGYILEKHGSDNVIKFDPTKNNQSGVLYQVHLGDNVNPQDMEFVSETKAYISNQNVARITIFDPSAGIVSGSIDISAYTFEPDSNTSPYANQMALNEGKLYVMLQRRNGWVPGAPTLILTIDVATDEIVTSDTIACQYKNGNDMVCVDGVLYITNPGSAYETGDGGIEQIDLATKTVSTMMDEATLGGNPNQIVHKSGSRFYVQNYIGWENVSVVEIDAQSGEIIETLPDITDAFGGIFYDSVEEKLYVGERNVESAGVKVFKNNELVAGPIHSDISLPPTSMAVVR